MAYRFEVDETVPTSVRRCAREQLQRAVDLLEQEVGTDPVGAVHGARKAIKKQRSLLRLAAPGLDADDRRRENSSLRSMAHELGGAREADALLGALDGLAERFAGQIPEATIELVRERLSKERDRGRDALLEAQVPARVSEELQAAMLRVENLSLQREGWKAIAGGLGRSYRRGRRAMRKARKAPTPELMHEWRKRSKDLWYELRLLKPIAPGAVGGAANDADRLADLLGDLHDLALLDNAVHRIKDDLPDDLDPLHGLIEHRLAQLESEAFSIGERVYAESPKALVKRMHRYWKAWRAAFTADSEQHPAELADATRHPTAA
jgi:CHAD domain-containing protein